ESRFQPAAVGPVTRSGARAQGIAQFMPGTAAERRLLDPFDPVQALPKSAEFLRELRDQFGNLGLAAAAYNAGPRRVQDWLDRALTQYSRAMTRLRSVVGDHDPNLFSSVFRSRGTRPFYQVRIGAETREEANGLCGQIQKAGQACLVLRNKRV